LCLAALGVLVVATVLVKLAQIQGDANDIARKDLRIQVGEARKAVEDSRRKLEEYKIIQSNIVDIQKRVNEDPNNAKLWINEGGADLLKYVSVEDAKRLRAYKSLSAMAAEFKRSLAAGSRRTFELDQSEFESLKAATRKYESLSTEYQRQSPPVFTDSMFYGAGALFVVIVGVFVGVYRFHLREITKNEQYKLGLMRIRVAANYSAQPGFDGEVRTALTKGAFDMPQEMGVLGRRRIESPLPGHPSTDIATLFFNRLMEQVDVVLQPKAK
jgi:hypothetical protein